jgi:hypothetical protein
LLGFILTTVGGALLGNYLQDRSKFKAQQEQVFSEVARQVDARMYRTRQLMWGLQGDVNYADTSSLWKEYRASLDSWNFDRNRNSVLLEMYFGAAARSCFQSIHHDFRLIGGSVERSGARKKELGAIAQDLDHLESRIYSFEREVLRHMNTRSWASLHFVCPTAIRAREKG